MEEPFEEHVPALQLEQVDEPELEYVPSEQGIQEVYPMEE